MMGRMQQLMERYEEITSRSLKYADNIPDLMKYENFDAEYLASHDEHFQKLDAMSHLDRAKLGAAEWNQWVQWAQLSDERWMVWEGVGDRRLVSIRPADQTVPRVDFYRENGIDFAKGQKRDEEDHFHIEIASFIRFVFPCPISFEQALFKDDAMFLNAWFVGDSCFDNVCFEESVMFYKVHFVRGARFGGAKFKKFVWFAYTQFKGVASFAGAYFEKYCKFSEVKFKKIAWFNEAAIVDWASFEGASFQDFVSFHRVVCFGTADWKDSQFDKMVDWSESHFFDKVDFLSCRFEATVDFDYAFFGKTSKSQLPNLDRGWAEDSRTISGNVPYVGAASKTVPNFRGAIFQIPPNLGFTNVAEPVAQQGYWWQWGKTLKAIFAKSSRTQDADAGAKLRRLQELAAAGHHHLAEKRFFRAELLCRRGHEATTWHEITMINLFELFSKCGLSFWRPIFWWANASVFFGFLYWLRSSRFGIGGLWTDLGHLVNYTLANAFPIVGVFHASNSRAVDALFGEAGGVPFDVGLMAGAHNIASTIFLFFALLAVRNYFKLG